VISNKRFCNFDRHKIKLAWLGGTIDGVLIAAQFKGVAMHCSTTYTMFMLGGSSAFAVGKRLNPIFSEYFSTSRRKDFSRSWILL